MLKYFVFYNKQNYISCRFIIYPNKNIKFIKYSIYTPQLLTISHHFSKYDYTNIYSKQSLNVVNNALLIKYYNYIHNLHKIPEYSNLVIDLNSLNNTIYYPLLFTNTDKSILNIKLQSIMNVYSYPLIFTIYYTDIYNINYTESISLIESTLLIK